MHGGALEKLYLCGLIDFFLFFVLTFTVFYRNECIF